MTIQHNSFGPRWFGRMARPLRVTLLLIVLLFCLVSIAITAAEVRSRLAALDAANSDNLQWNVMQTEVEALRLQQAIDSALQARGTEAQPFALDEVRRWFNVYYSRIAMLQNSDIHGTQLQQPAYKTDVETILRILDNGVVFIDGGDAALIDALPAFVPQTADLREASRSLTLTSLAEFSAKSDAERERISATLLRLAAVTAFLMLMLATFSVVTARLYRTAESRAAALRQTGGRLSTIVANSADAIVVTDRAGIIQEFNPAAQTIFGMPRDAALGQDAMRMLFAEGPEGQQRGGLIAALEKTVLAGRGPLRIEVDGRRADGSSFPVEVSIAMTQPSDMRLIVAFVRDISERRRAQAELETALDRAVAGEKTKARFLAVMSHEMRTPLNGLLGSMTLMANTGLSDEQQELLRIMSSSGSILLGHVNSVLDISRAEAGAMQVVARPFDLEGLIDEVIANQTGLAVAAGNRIVRVTLDEKVGLVSGDAARIRQVLLNLVGNAVKFTRDGTITVESERLPDSPVMPGQHSVEIRVIDTGIGIAEDEIDTIFEDFVTLDTRYERSTGGTGLGLGIARRLIEAMGGEIGVESEPGEGSLFWVRLPLPAPDGTTAAAPAAVPSATPAATATPAAADSISDDAPGFSEDLPVQTPMDVLTVEDNEINRFLLLRYLNSAGHRVVVAVDGVEGVALAADKRFDVILMDISMPRMDGIEATRRIRLGGASQSARIVALTAHALPEELARFRAAGMDATLTKPIGRQDLLAALVGVMPESGGTPAPSTPGGPAVDRRALSDLRRQIGASAASGLVMRLIKDGDDTLRFVTAQPLDGRHVEIAARCHQLAGTGGTFGTVKLREQLMKIEDRLTRGDLDGIDKDLDRLRRLWAETRDILVHDAAMAAAEPG